MAIRLGPLGSGGECCTCEEFTGCDCVTAACSLICESKTLTATMCGIEEYTDPSSPPKKYRLQTTSGELKVTGYTEPTCTTCNGFSGRRRFIYSGTYAYDASSCAETNTQIEDSYAYPADGSALCDDAAPFLSSSSVAKIWSPVGVAGTTQTNSKTAKVFTGPNTCPSPAGDRITGEARADLTQEDTEDDAEDRGAAAVGSWTACTDPCNCTTLTAYREDRGSGFTWDARVVRIKATGTGLAASSSYQATIQYQRRPYGSTDPDAWEDFAQEFQPLFTGEGETEATAADWVEIPNSRGFETRAVCSGIELLT